MPLSQITSGGTHQANDYQAGVGQLRVGFRHLLQHINEGRLGEAQQAYSDLSQRLPRVFQSVSSKLTRDYDEIGVALREGDLGKAQRAVVELRKDLQGMGRSETASRTDPNGEPGRNLSAATGNLMRTYHSGAVEGRTLGTLIDIYV